MPLIYLWRCAMGMTILIGLTTDLMITTVWDPNVATVESFFKITGLTECNKKLTATTIKKKSSLKQEILILGPIHDWPVVSLWRHG
jgi:hypothetical protein